MKVYFFPTFEIFYQKEKDFNRDRDKITTFFTVSSTTIDAIYYDDTTYKISAESLGNSLRLENLSNTIHPINTESFSQLFSQTDIQSDKNLLIIGNEPFLYEVIYFLLEESGIIEFKPNTIISLEYEDSWKLADMVHLDLVKEPGKDMDIENMRRYFNAILDFSSDFFYTKDAEYRFGAVNSNFAHMAGHNHWSEILNKTDYDLFPKELADKYRTDDKMVIEQGIPIKDRLESYPKEDGSDGWIKTSKSPIKDENRNIVGMFGFSAEVTSLIEAEKEITEQKQEFETIFQTIKDGIAILDLNTNFLFFNDAFLKMTGFTKEELLKKSCNELQFSKNDKKLKKLFEKIAQKGYVENIEKTLFVKDGKRLQVNMSVALMPDKQRLLVSLKDVTEAKQKEMLLKEYVKMIDDHVFISTTDINGNIIKVSNALSKISGYKKKELIGNTHRIFRHKDMPSSIYKEMWETITANKTWHGELKNKRKDGSSFWANIIISPMFDEFGEKTGYTAIRQDITDKILVEEKRKEQESLLSLFDHGDSVLFRWNNDENWSIDYVSSNVANLLGYTREEFINSEILYSDCIHKDDLQRVIDEVAKGARSSESFFKHEPYRVVTKNGNIKWILDYTVIQKDLNDKVTHFLGYIIDITEQENTLKNLERFIDTQDNIVILTDGKDITFANRKFFEYLGYTDLESFRLKYECICELFIKNDRFFHLGKVANGENWIDIIQTLPYSQRIVSLMGKNLRAHTFSISINKFDENLLIISFTDISQTIDKQFKLEEKTIHDKLTNAYNREYFELNYSYWIKEFVQHGYQLGLVLLDIDHFKTVNDTYGHDIGDTVLIHFVDTIKKHSRTDDLLIRWGGEEFILILKIRSSEDLYKVLEYLRKAIEAHEFPSVGQKTCSMGGTIYKKGEDIETTIKRADIGVYEAKENGRNRVVIK